MDVRDCVGGSCGGPRLVVEEAELVLDIERVERYDD